MRTAAVNALKENRELDRQTRIRRRIRRASFITLVLVAAVPACIFDSGNYQGGGRTGSGAATGGTASDTSTASAPNTGEPTSTSTSMGTDSGSSSMGQDASEGG